MPLMKNSFRSSKENINRGDQSKKKACDKKSDKKAKGQEVIEKHPSVNSEVDYRQGRSIATATESESNLFLYMFIFKYLTFSRL